MTMNTLKVIGSGSSGNCYILTCDNEKLILDCGLPIKVIKQGLNFNLQGIQGVVVTHEHKDHSLSVADFERMGIPVFKRYTHEDITDRVRFGSFKIISFDLPHNGTTNYGFYIKVGGQKILYLTDFEYCKYNFKSLNINHIIVECNYQQELVDRDSPNYEHKIRGHCSLNTCKDFIKANATDSLKTVILCHLGQETAEPQECINEVQKIVPGANVCVAERGLEVELRKKGECPF